jgi:hypothetical protein
MKFGDTIRIEVKGRDGLSVFGAIEQEVVPVEARIRAAATSSAATEAGSPAGQPDSSVSPV